MEWKASLTVLVALIMLVPLVQAPPAPADDPVVNGEFELFIPSQAAETLEGTPADECTGIGHQIFYGSETWQQKAENAATAAADGDASGAQSHATAAANQIANNPIEEAKFFAGYGHCVFSQEEGYDVVWFNPVETAREDAVHWSQADGNTQFAADFDDDEFDREVKIGANASASGHNLWQAWPSPHQAYSGSFDDLTFRVEDGEIPSSASVKVSLSATPSETVHQYVLLWLDCDLTFTAEQLTSSKVGDTVQADPADAIFRSRDDSCDAAKQAWDGASSDEERRDVLGRLRIVQLSFWGFNRGSQDVVLDGVGLEGTTTPAEEIADGNHNLI